MSIGKGVVPHFSFHEIFRFAVETEDVSVSSDPEKTVLATIELTRGKEEIMYVRGNESSRSKTNSTNVTQKLCEDERKGLWEMSTGIGSELASTKNGAASDASDC